MSYGRVTWEDRIKIKLLLQQGKSNAVLCDLIFFDKHFAKSSLPAT
jgi:hypothetical protein